MSKCYSGQNYNIVPRLQKEGRSRELICLQFETQESLDGKDSWMPCSKEEFWPICPNVGDKFAMESFYNSEDEADKPNKFILWEVVCRYIMYSGPSAQEMYGIVRLLVKAIK